MDDNKQQQQQNALGTDSPNTSVLAAFKIVIVEYFLSTTAHALPNIFRTSNIIIKVIWLLCFLASTAYCIKSMVVSLQDFLQYPSYISTEVHQKIPDEFPAVTVCNLKTVNKDSNYFNTSYFQNYILTNLDPNTPLYNTLSQQYFVRTAVNNDTSLTDDTRKAVGFQMKDMFVGCFFNYQNYGENDFTYSYHAQYGNCYTFNKGKYENGTIRDINKVSVAGKTYGLMLELFVGDASDQSQFEYSDGLVVVVHNRTSQPFSGDNVILASTGAETDITVTRNFISRLEAPYGDCLKDVSTTSSFNSELFNYIVRTEESAYSQKYCYSLCVQRMIIDYCGCMNTYMPVFKDEKKDYCNGKTQIPCMLALVNTFGNTEAATACSKQCPFECDSIEYETSTSRSTFPTDFYRDKLANMTLIKNSGVSKDNIPRSMVRVNVFYKNMVYKTTTQNIQTSTEDFFSNIGGTLGLYIGISMLSLVEIVELAINLIVALISVKKTKKQVTNLPLNNNDQKI